MDPSKRICLKNLPEKCTKREIAELVKNRTGAQPHSIDLGTDAEGNIRRYAHFSCEGAKAVIEVLQSGVTLRGETVYGHPADMHYSFRYAEATRKREREEEEEKQNLEAFWAAQRERFQKKMNGGELPSKPPKHFYAAQRKYATIAAEIAAKCRAAHRNGGAAPQPAAAEAAAPATNSRFKAGGAAAAAGYPRADPTAYTTVYPYLRPPTAEPQSSSGAEGAPEGDANQAGSSSPNERRPRVDKKHAKGRPAKKSKPEAAPAPPPPPPPPPQPTKEERKLTGLQAKLAALKEKMKK